MTPPHDAYQPPDPTDGPDEPSELTDAFRTQEVRLAPPPGAFAAVRRRAAARRRRRVLAVGTGVAVCLAGATVVVAMARPGDDGPVTAGPSAQDPAPPGPERSSAAPEAEEDDRPERPTEEDRDTGTSPEPDDPGGSGPTDGAGDGGQQDGSGGTGETEGGDGPGAAGVGPPDCDARQLGVSLGRPGGAAGSVTYVLTFINNGTEPCAVLGFPGVALVSGEGGEPIGSPAAQGRERGPAAAVELAPGGTAQADLRIARAENYPEADCSPTPAPGLRVQAPEAAGGQYLPLDGITGCTDPDTGLLSVTALYGQQER
ncbi:DUF4232 domain-containing protein [Streptomyces sp. MP131-18]|uniref:DUF4232 domain-containing protein n=1 Tax=Streptomyces sp. MP131-18 TaxID=1857892 RepID=UPI00097C3099|nr:DUF4232 domain-containing protein [Streptomyces sp. MP131-18]ONK11309.1 hypothetical protein STBA_20400 [Streptomyces sp. MP131-18]